MGFDCYFCPKNEYRNFSKILKKNHLYPSYFRHLFIYLMERMKRWAVSFARSGVFLAYTSVIKNVKYEKISPLSQKTDLIIAGGPFTFRSERDWAAKFKDSERFESLHRWGWLLHPIASNPRQPPRVWGEEMMRSWLSHKKLIQRKLVDTPYTAGERVVNALIFYFYAEDFDLLRVSIPDDISMALKQMAKSVFLLIEQYGKTYTNNHVIQNARTLLFFGYFFNEKSMKKRGLFLLMNEIPLLVTDDGFLREGSSHYHFLFTRWVLEIAWILEYYNEKEALNFIRPFAGRLLEKCYFFLIYDTFNEEWLIPLFGDISPDCSPRWLLGLPWSPLAQRYFKPPLASPIPISGSGWHTLWERLPLKSSATNTAPSKHLFQDYSSSGWYRYDRGDVSIFWHIEDGRLAGYPTHGHNDTCSFVLFLKGRPIFIDIGRISYETVDKFYNYSGSAQSHNTVAVDGFGLTPSQKCRLFPTSYNRSRIYTEVLEGKSQCTFSIYHSGFERVFGDKIEFKRIFTISDFSIEISDIFTGSAYHNIESFYHLAPGIELSHDSNDLILSAKNLPRMRFLINKTPSSVVSFVRGEKDSQAGWCSLEYGTKIPIYTIMHTQWEQFPVMNKYILEWNTLCAE